MKVAGIADVRNISRPFKHYWTLRRTRMGYIMSKPCRCPVLPKPNSNPCAWPLCLFALDWIRIRLEERPSFKVLLCQLLSLSISALVLRVRTLKLEAEQGFQLANAGECHTVSGHMARGTSNISPNRYRRLLRRSCSVLSCST
jgi:hypothetical protein